MKLPNKQRIVNNNRNININQQMPPYQPPMGQPERDRNCTRRPFLENVRQFITGGIDSQKMREFVRFTIVGIIATGIHYGIYLLLIGVYDIDQSETTYADIAYTIGYFVSFLCNLWLTAHYTFREQLNIKRSGGFALSHGVNYLLHIALLTFFLWIGIPNKWAPIPVFCIVIPINFLLVRFVFKSKYFKR